MASTHQALILGLWMVAGAHVAASAHVGGKPRLELDVSHRQILQDNQQQQPAPPTLPSTPEGHCQLSRPEVPPWCSAYYAQAPQPVKPLKRGTKSCPGDCNGWGVCDYDHGICYCSAGYGGPDCTQPRKRNCHKMMPNRRDIGWHNHSDWAHTRCSGICDPDIAMCYCPPETKHGRIDAPPGSPPRTPPVRLGRPLFMCNPQEDAAGKKIPWGGVPWEDMFGESGWCNADVSKWKCPCRIDGVVGELCNIPVEHYCKNQCSGHGECDQGFCHCHAGWYGADCSRKRGDLPYTEDDMATLKHRQWVANVVTPPAAAVDPPPAGATRLRPFIYVYDMKPEYSTDIMQYRIERSHCVWRLYEFGNHTMYLGWNAYAVESALHEMFLTSPHRTYDPEEADFFYVPLEMACLFDVYGWNSHPQFPPGTHGPRPYGAAMMQREAVRWLNATFPWWQRRGGRDHVFLTAHDEGACYVTQEVWPAIFLTHWGRMDFPHASHTSYLADNYSVPVHHPLNPGDWLDITSKAHPCYDPKKDLVIPTWGEPSRYARSPFMGAKEPQPRRMKAFFRGDIGLRKWDPDGKCYYSRCMRQKLFNMSRDGDWQAKYGIYIGWREDIPGDYSALLSDSTFCLVMAGEGWGHPEDSILHGCIPVIIIDQVHQPFESILDYDKFAVRVKQADIERLPAILGAFTPEQIAEKRSNLAKVWFRFRYMQLKPVVAAARVLVRSHAEENGGKPRETDGVQYADNSVDDAFGTIVQWLYSRIPFVHAKPGAAAAGVTTATA